MAKSKYSNEEIANVIKSGRYRDIVEHRKNLIVQLKERNQLGEIYSPVTTSNSETGETFFESELLNVSHHHNPDVDIALKLVHRRKKTLKKFLSRIKHAFRIAKKLYHLTVTFTKKAQLMLGMSQMRQELYSFLKSFGEDVIFFGTVGIGKDGGIHFHIVIDRKVDKKAWKHSSYLGIREILNDKVQIVKMAKYLTKNHLYSRVDPSIKSRVIFKRSNKSPLIWGNTNNTENTTKQSKTIPFYTINNAISSINKSKQYPIYMDNVL
jgi:hypothetical protein